MIVNFNRNSWHYKFWDRTHGGWKKDHKNLCPYFWDIVFSFLLLPLTWVGYLDPSNERKEKIGPTFVFYLLYGWTTIVSCGLATQEENPIGFDVWWWKFLAGPIVFALVIALGITLFALVFCGIMWCKDEIVEFQYRRNIRKNVEFVQEKKNPGVISSFIKAKKEKYCPVIEWDKD